MGRPSDYSETLASTICERLTEGESLRTICKADDMPSASTVFKWLGEHESFSEQYARAREAQADLMDAKILDVADLCTAETATADRVKIDAYKWRAGKLKPKVYGDKQQVEHSGNIGIGTALDALPDA